MESGRMEQNIIQNLMETDRNYWKLLRIVQGLGSVNPYSYPCCHAQPCDLWCQRQAMSVTGCQLQKAHIALTSFVEEYKHLYISDVLTAFISVDRASTHSFILLWNVLVLALVLIPPNLQWSV